MAAFDWDKKNALGLPIMEEHSSLEVYIELKGRQNDSLHLNRLVEALHSDPDQARISLAQRATVMQDTFLLGAILQRNRQSVLSQCSFSTCLFYSRGCTP